MSAQHLVLVPGFFGFVNFGELVYFAHVREILEAEFRRQRADVRVHRVRTHPVASLRKRAQDLRDVLAGLPDDGPVHIVGHSTGGLDARLVGIAITTALIVVAETLTITSRTRASSDRV